MEENTINNKFFQEYTLIKSTDYQEMVEGQNLKEHQQVGGQLNLGNKQLDEDLLRVKHSADANLIFYVQQLRKLHAIIMAIVEGRLKESELPHGWNLAGLLKRKQKLLDKYGYRMLSMGIAPATFIHERKMEELARQNLASNIAQQETAERNLLQNRRIASSNKNIASTAKEILDTNEDIRENTKIANHLLRDLNEVGPQKIEYLLEEPQESFSEMLEEAGNKIATSEPPNAVATLQKDDGKMMVQAPQTREHSMTTRSQIKKQTGKGISKRKKTLKFLLPADSKEHLVRHLFRHDWVEVE